MTSRVDIEPGGPDPQHHTRLRAFWSSCYYSDDILTKKIDVLLSEAERVRFAEECDAQEDVDRKKFINDRIDERGRYSTVEYSRYRLRYRLSSSWSLQAIKGHFIDFILCVVFM